MNTVPTKIKRLETGLHIEWPDGLSAELGNHLLRGSCRCAKCVSEDTGQRMVGMNEVSGAVRWTNVHLIGNYAIGIAFSDGHDTGIYAYSYLRELAENETAG